MEGNKCYKIEAKGSGILPRTFCRWAVLKENMGFDETHKYLQGSSNTHLLRVRQEKGSTLLTYLHTPNWSSEQSGRHHHRTIFEGALSPSIMVLYRVTPRLRVSFEE